MPSEVKDSAEEILRKCISNSLSEDLSNSLLHVYDMNSQIIFD